MSESELDGQVALVTGGGRGVGEGIAREAQPRQERASPPAPGPRDQVEEVAREIGGLAIVADASPTVPLSESMVDQVEAELGPIDLLVAKRWAQRSRAESVGGRSRRLVESSSRSTFSGVYLCCRAVIPGMLERFED